MRDRDSPVVADRNDGVALREVLKACAGKYRGLTAVLERLAPSATPQPLSAGTPGGIAVFQVLPDLCNNIPSFSGGQYAPSSRGCIENFRTTAKLDSWPESFMLETAKSRFKSFFGGPSLARRVRRNAGAKFTSAYNDATKAQWSLYTPRCGCASRRTCISGALVSR
ncbi:hypothetical protein MTO96_027202 [Rhipicephalus appendiculatus]